jgi:4-alpha-glucanotransferase
MPFIAEDLGTITSDVIALRDRYSLPGMKILQFAFGGNASNDYLPHNYPQNCIAYTGTHDNAPSEGWYQSVAEYEKQFCSHYLGNNKEEIAHAMIRVIWSSVAGLTIAPMQDFLCLGNSTRMNTPATTQDNWQWRMKPDAITDKLVEWIKGINTVYSRSTNNKLLDGKEEIFI